MDTYSLLIWEGSKYDSDAYLIPNEVIDDSMRTVLQTASGNLLLTDATDEENEALWLIEETIESKWKKYKREIPRGSPIKANITHVYFTGIYT